MSPSDCLQASVTPQSEFPFVIEGVEEPDTTRRIFQAMSNLDTLDLLRARKVSPDWKWGIDNYSGLWDRMSLLRAVKDNRLDIVQLIVTHSCRKNPPDKYGRTPLHVAAWNGHTQVCRLIIDSVQEKNPPNNDGETPLQIAQLWGRTEVVRLIQNAMDGGSDQ